jgi:putative DNA primase/helicase
MAVRRHAERAGEQARDEQDSVDANCIRESDGEGGMTSFIDFARTYGVEISALRSGDRIWRCPTTTHPRSRNGAYYFDGSRGWCQNWETGEPAQWWNDPHAKPWTDSDKAAWARRRDEEARERARRQRLAANRAAELLATCESKPHNYLAGKGFPDVPAMVAPDYAMVIPMRDVQSNELLGAQVIAIEDGQWAKKMLPGMRAKGAVLRLGPKRVTESVLVEGFATALSVEAAVKRLCIQAAVYVTFSANNLAHVADLLAGKRYVFADNDASGTGERVAEATGLPWVASDVVGEDANDLHQRAGVMTVAKLLLAARVASAGGRAQ